VKLSSVPLLSGLFSRRAAAPAEPPPPPAAEPRRRPSSGDATSSSDVMPARGVKAATAPAPDPAAPPPDEEAAFPLHRQAPPPTPATMTVMDHAIRAIDADLVSLLNMTGATLCRALRPPVGSSSGSVARQVRVGTAAARARATMAAMASAEGGEGVAAKHGGANSPFGPFPKGMEIAQSIEQRVRGLSLETSLTPQQAGRLERVSQNALDLHLALRCARYAWQISVLMNDDPLGRSVFARIKPVTQAVVELNGRVASVLEGQHDTKEAAAAIAGQYRTVFGMQEEVVHSVRGEHSVAARLARAGLCCLTLSAENMARVAARHALPDNALRPAVSKIAPPPDINDGILLPLTRR